MSTRGLRAPEGARRRRLHRRRHALRRARRPKFWEDWWAGDEEACLVHARRTEELFPRLWLPGGWAGQYGGYQSQLKAMMKMLGQPGGEPRRPRLPVDDPQALARDPRGARRVRPAAGARGGMTSSGASITSASGVADMEAAKAFYGRVGFSDVRFDYTGRVPGPGPRGARRDARATRGATPVGPGRDQARAGARRRRAAAGARPAAAGASSGSARSACTRAASTGVHRQPRRRRRASR